MTSQPLLKDLLRPASGPLPVFSDRRYDGDCVVNPVRPAVFEHCTFRNVRFEAAKASRASLAGSRFLDCSFESCYFGPATLDLRNTAFLASSLKHVVFMLGKLAASDFSDSHLKDVAFRSADLTGSSFRRTKLTRVSFERATLQQADFTDCTLVQGDFWGEPPWDGAIVDDDIRYSFAIIEAPLQRIEQLLSAATYSVAERERFVALREWLLRTFSGVSVVMLHHRELRQLFDKATFVWLLKQLKGAA